MASHLNAVFILQQVLQKRRLLTDVLNEYKRSDLKEIAAIQEICYGTLRWFFRLECILQALISKSFKKKDHDIELLLLVGLFQLLFMRIPSYAIVSKAVEATRMLKKPWAAAIVNAVLRNFLRKKETLLRELHTQDAFRWAHPPWLKKAIEKAWGAKAPAIFESNNEHPPMTLRVNTHKVSVEDYWIRLGGRASAERTYYSPQGLILKTPCTVAELPLFEEGAVFVQDEAGQLAVPLLQLAPFLRVLDACAAPGSKSAHILELEPTVALTCTDKDPDRLKLLEKNLKRLGGGNIRVRPPTLKAARIQSLDDWWDGELFDRILLDAPCSATGVIRRHPDIKVLKTEADISKLAAEQRELLETLWPLLKPGGILLYTTCSILPEENHLQLARFLKEHQDAQEVPIGALWGIDVSPGKQILPGMNNMDGFYYGRVIKEGVTPYT